MYFSVRYFESHSRSSSLPFFFSHTPFSCQWTINSVTLPLPFLPRKKKLPFPLFFRERILVLVRGKREARLLACLLAFAATATIPLNPFHIGRGRRGKGYIRGGGGGHGITSSPGKKGRKERRKRAPPPFSSSHSVLPPHLLLPSSSSSSPSGWKRTEEEERNLWPSPKKVVLVRGGGGGGDPLLLR